MGRRFLLVLAAGVAAVAAACSEPAVVSTPDSTSLDPAVTSPINGNPSTTATPPAETVPTSSSIAAPVGPAEIGSTVTLAGSESRVAVTVTAVADPAPPSQFLAPEPGTHYVAVQLRLVNVGTAPYRDSPSNGAKLLDAGNQQHAATFVNTGAGPDLSSVTIAPGDTRSGWVAFAMPDGVATERFTLALDSGFGPQIGDWLLTGGTPGDPAPPVTVPEAGPGSGLGLRGVNGEQVQVTLTAVADPAPSGQYSVPADGKRFVAVQLRLMNVGAAPYSDSPANGMTLVDSYGQGWRSTFIDSGAGVGFEGGTVTLAPNDERVGWVTFEVPADAVIVKMTMALSSGFADLAGEWRLS